MSVYWISTGILWVCILANTISLLHVRRKRIDLETRIVRCQALIDDLEELRERWFLKAMGVSDDGNKDKPTE